MAELDHLSRRQLIKINPDGLDGSAAGRRSCLHTIDSQVTETVPGDRDDVQRGIDRSLST